MDEKLVAEDLTYRIRSSIFAVANTLGPGFLEKVYENALAIELRSAGLAVSTQVPIRVFYKRQIVGDYQADLLTLIPLPVWGRVRGFVPDSAML